MPNKDYDVAKRFTEVARRAREINTAPKKKIEPKPEYDANAYDTRPGKPQGSVKLYPNGTIKSEPSMSGKDRNLSVETASPEVRKRIADSMSSKSIAQQVHDAGEEEKKRNPRFKNFGLVKR